MNLHSETASLLQTLRTFSRSTAPKEWCELCSKPIPPTHRHLLEKANRRLVCACESCALTFQPVRDGRFKLVPREIRLVEDFQITDSQWENLALPINLVFIYHNSTKQKPVASYPSPAGATESLLALPQWNELVSANPRLSTMQADVQALLANRLGNSRDYFIAPIDVCYELVGLIRAHWRGLSGGEAVWLKMNEFFARLKAQSTPDFGVNGASGNEGRPRTPMPAERSRETEELNYA